MIGDILLVCWDCKKIAQTDEERLRFELYLHWGHKLTLIEDQGDEGFAINDWEQEKAEE
ncbi:unnamed protein product, partial [marine sediment metagenome]